MIFVYEIVGDEKVDGSKEKFNVKPEQLIYSM